MAKQGLLNDAKLRQTWEPKPHHDGGGLYFQVTKKRSRSWIYRYELRGRVRHMGLGAYPETSLKQARSKHADAKKLRDAGVDPIIARDTQRQETANAVSVEAACDAYITAQQVRFQTERHVAQIRQRLRDYVIPVIGHLSIDAVEGPEVRQVLSPIWVEKHATAGRVRQYMEDVTDWAIHEGHRRSEHNPWEAKRLRFALPFGVRKVKSHPALAYADAPNFLAEVRQQDGVKARAMEFVMLTAVRIADICGGGKAHSEPMKWSHVDLVERTWRIPDTKMGRPHVVPLSEPALRLLDEMQRYRDPATDYVFVGANAGTVLNGATLRHMLKAMGRGGEVTTHGMRSCFKTWSSECTHFEKDVIESCLAHAKTGMDRPYMRGDYLAKRTNLMSLWGAYLEGEAVKATGTVVALRA